jgi:hypothetical protein
MARKLTFGLALLVLALVVTSVSFANNIPTVIVFGPGTSSSSPTVAVTPGTVAISAVSGPVLQGGSTGTFTLGALTAALSGPNILAPNSTPFTVNIGPDTLTGTATLTLFASGTFLVGSVTHTLDVFAGSYLVATASPGFVATGFRPNELATIDFNVLDGSLSSGELAPAVPEPGTIALVGSGLLAMAGLLRRKL